MSINEKYSINQAYKPFFELLSSKGIAGPIQFTFKIANSNDLDNDQLGQVHNIAYEDWFRNIGPIAASISQYSGRIIIATVPYRVERGANLNEVERGYRGIVCESVAFNTVGRISNDSIDKTVTDVLADLQEDSRLFSSFVSRVPELHKDDPIILVAGRSGMLYRASYSHLSDGKGIKLIREGTVKIQGSKYVYTPASHNKE
ncbi:MAG: hypothetical protein ACMXYE_00030 [Candidatus Woesearchaeota archaeon]